MFREIMGKICPNCNGAGTIEKGKPCPKCFGTLPNDESTYQSSRTAPEDLKLKTHSFIAIAIIGIVLAGSVIVANFIWDYYHP